MNINYAQKEMCVCACVCVFNDVLRTFLLTFAIIYL